jgi:hypothetical protein
LGSDGEVVTDHLYGLLFGDEAGKIVKDSRDRLTLVDDAAVVS